jgi:type I restriction-modification system DNA methylase subunit
VFKKAVLNRFSENSEILKSRFEKFQEFHKKRKFAESVKEEKYQDGFLKDIFENCLGYILENSDPEKASIFREEKNETDGKKADGVIRIGGKVVGIIELKDHKTKNLNLVEEQAFNYHNSHSNSKYIITSNFTELRFYIDKKTEFESFKLFEMDFEGFAKLHKILSFESISENRPLQFLEQSQNFERDISEKFYKDFSEVREKISEEISEKNEISDLDSLNSAQKILDRLVFLFFGESRGLLKFSKTYILETWKNDIYENPLWETLKIIFRKVDVGGKIPKTYAYNGGLFAKDENLDSLKIGDEVLEKAVNLGTYDFSTELDVNILGHIFENSLDDLQKLQNSEKIRKRDGVFYTPQYITKYIVENTVGELCRENWKRIVKNETETELLEYRKFLENLRILDPAVGSGAFLNETLDFLVKEHEKLREKLLPFGDLTLGYEFDKEILENNLFGVDINSSAIEIAKLSLWIRTAKPNRKLSNLNENLKVANSLLEMPFDEKSFDIVLGNPPYVRVQGLKANEKSESEKLENRFKSVTGNYDIYVLFMEKALDLISENGKVGFILPHKFLISEFGKGIRGVLSEKKALESLVHFGSEIVFKDASTYTCILTMSNGNEFVKFAQTKPENLKDLAWSKIDYENLSTEKWILKDGKISEILKKLEKQPHRAGDIFERIFQGLKTSGDKIYLLEKSKNGLFSKSLNRIVEIETGLLKPALKGEDISRYGDLENRYFVIFPYLIENGKAQPMTENYISENFPNGYKYLKENEEFLRNREKGKMNKEGWFLYIYPKSLTEFEKEKIIVQELSHGSNFSFDNIGKAIMGQYGIIIKNKFYKFKFELLAVLNSSLMWFFIKNTSSEFRGGYFAFQTKYIEPFPIPDLKELSESGISDFAKKLLELNSDLKSVKNSFLDEVELPKIPKKIQNFEQLDLNEFIKELAKAKKLKFKDKLSERNFKNEWKSIFENDSKEVLKLQKQIFQIENEIDKTVFKLYDLNEDEILIVEN